MTDKPLQRVQKFHQTFQVETSKTPCIPEKSICQLRIDLIQEELNELKEAFDNNDIVGIADALGDLSVVVDGTYDVCGLSDYKEPISEEIFNSNMSKADENGRPIFREDGKVLKGPNYFRPNLHKVLGLKNQEDNDNA
tara:strand:- start:327 stop:740 length:414 start_codon:yes stop_codon:yes gene_type:complete